tara:strand:+ start:2646 stop:3473 length:828 start_codon:yes stop_codon:yes gene_type:complete
MDAIVGLGQAGCNIADYFSKAYTQYQVYKFDKNLKDGLNTYCLPTYNNHEKYDESSLNLRFLFSELKNELLFVVAGSGVVSGATLRILEQLRDRDITLLYIRPDMSLLGENARLRDAVTFNVLQEYARSGVFRKMIMISNPELERILDGVSVMEYNSRLNELLCNTIHMMNAYDHIKPAMTTFSGLSDISRICTIGMVDQQKGEEQLFYPLVDIEEKMYYYLINENDLRSDKQALNRIRDFVKNQSCEKAFYTIWPTTYEYNYAYVCAYSSVIQQ